MNYEISHKTVYRYNAQVLHSQHLVHMSPRDVRGQTIHRHSLTIDPVPVMRSDDRDAFGNPVSMLDIERPHDVLVVHARSTVTVSGDVGPPLESIKIEDLEAGLRAAPSHEQLELRQMRCPSRLTDPTAEIKAFAASSFTRGRTLLEGAIALSERIHRDFTFDPAATDVSTPITDVFRLRRGVCQDFAHLMLAGLRSLGIPARYVSGYILTRPPAGYPRLLGADASHAWVGVWTGPGGYAGIDPTNGLIAADEHITFAWGRDYDDISPISGVLIGGGEHRVDVEVDVLPIT